MEYGEKVLLKEFKNGNKLWGISCKCAKCHGTGKVIWSYANHVCFDCDGKGWYYEEEREYTPANLAKLEAKRQKEREKQDAERAAQEAEAEERRKQEEAERMRREAERLAEIERNRGQFVGQVGDKLELEVTLDRTFSYEVPCYGAPWKTDTVTGYVFKTDDGNTLVWRTTGCLHRKVEDEHGWIIEGEKKYTYIRPEEGKRLKIRGTIKGHQEYNNVNQTELQRVKWIQK